VFHERSRRGIVFGADGNEAHLIRREAEREVVGGMLDQETDEPFMHAQPRAMDAER